MGGSIYIPVMDTKYGRLFTEEDVAKLLDHLNIGFEAELPEVITQAEKEGVGFRFPADEPQFVLRGQDVDALEAVEAYQGIREENEHITPSQAESLLTARDGFRAFRNERPDRMKVAD